MTETQSFYGNKVLELLPGQPSLRYPATREEKREKDEEEAEGIITLCLTALVERVRFLGLSREDAIDLIREVFDRELKQ